MKQFKRAKVVILSTKQKSNFPFFLDKSETRNGGRLFLNEGINKNKWNWDVIEQKHLYITSDEEIKEGDWCIDSITKTPFQVKSIERNRLVYPEGSKKIITTTDKSLKLEIDGSRGNLLPDVSFDIELPQPSQSFIKKYVKEYNEGNIINDVLVEYEYQYHSSKEFYGKNASWVSCDKKQYNLIKETIPTCPVRETLKVNSKDNTITIKKVKDSWNRKEVIELIRDFEEQAAHAGANSAYLGTEQWIEKNL